MIWFAKKSRFHSAILLFSSLLHFCIRSRVLQFFNKIMCNCTRRKTWCSFWQNFLEGRFVSGHYVAHIWAFWTVFYRVISRILSIKIQLHLSSHSAELLQWGEWWSRLCWVGARQLHRVSCSISANSKYKFRLMMRIPEKIGFQQ